MSALSLFLSSLFFFSNPDVEGELTVISRFIRGWAKYRDL